MPSHEATRGFDRSAGAYDRGRPDYPEVAVRHLVEHMAVTSRSNVLELGAGTGKFTAMLTTHVPHVVTSDPSSTMRRALHAKWPHLPCLAARAEYLPVSASRFDAVVCAQAFHWFANDLAVREIHRVLKSGGYLGLIWNVRNEEIGWVRALTEIMEPYEGDVPRYRDLKWKAPLVEAGFSPLEYGSFSHVVRCDFATVVDRVASVSFIAALEESEHRRVREAVLRMLQTHPDTRHQTVLEFPYRTDVYWCSKQSSAPTRI